MATINLETLSYEYPITALNHKREPLWGSDTGRNSNSGAYSGTFIGYFDQLEIEFGETSQTQMMLLRGMFDNATISVRFKDSKTGGWQTWNFYGTAIESKLTYWGGTYEPFTIKLTALKKRG